MCGILAFIGNEKTTNILEKRKRLLELSKSLRHRGPDSNGIYLDETHNIAIAHERLSIVGVGTLGAQPIIDNDNYILSVNGEIYNYKSLYTTVLHDKYTPITDSDCEVIIHLYKEFGSACVKMLDGIFGFVLYDKINNKILVARDPIGIIPLYYGYTSENEFMVASEMKALADCNRVELFPPGNFLEINKNVPLTLSVFGQFTRYFKPNWDSNYSIVSSNESKTQLYSDIRTKLINAVDKRLMSDVPFGVLVSGGLDSSLITAITSRLIKEKDDVWGKKLHTFSIGLKGAPDLKYAKIVSDFLGTIHHEFNFTVQQGIDCLEDLIWHLETYDKTTIRASTPMFLMSRLIKSMGIKMVLSGEGADEILGGYLYFHNAPNNKEFHEECLSRVKNLHNFDCLRANKSTMAYGVEARVPFLDKSFMETAIPIDPSLKLSNGGVCGKKKIEKYVLRKAFEKDEHGEPYLPDEILWRQKEQFSDGVGYSWIDGLKEYIDKQISDDIFDKTIHSGMYTDDIPKDKEELFYRQIFDRQFPNRYKIVPRWIPKMDWDGVSYDPSGRAQKVHDESTCQ
jgi:asparagine synthase (glutamine-hydrolysing)